MIIQIRGISGSGKSWAMRKVMQEISARANKSWEPITVPNRRKPLYYRIGSKFATVGHYETECGGGDTVGSAPEVFREMQALIDLGIETILCEGLLLSEDVIWSSKLPDLRVLYLTTPFDTCIKQILSRRETAGNTRPLNIEKSRVRIGTIERTRPRLQALGIECRRCLAEQVPEIVLRWLKNSP